MAIGKRTTKKSTKDTAEKQEQVIHEKLKSTPKKEKAKAPIKAEKKKNPALLQKQAKKQFLSLIDTLKA